MTDDDRTADPAETLQLISCKEAKAKGLKRFFTGRPCKSGHIAPRLVSCGKCVECLLERDRRYSKANKERVGAYKAEWAKENEKHLRDYKKGWNKANRERISARKKRLYQENKEEVKAKVRGYAKANPEKIKLRNSLRYEAGRDTILAKNRQRRLSNLDRYRAMERAYGEANKEAKRAAAKAWRKANPEKRKALARACRHRRRARIHGAGGSYTYTDVLDILKMQRGRCAWCRVKLKDSRAEDHIQPLARGGSNYRRNIQILCTLCNLEKGAQDPIEFARKKGRLL